MAKKNVQGQYLEVLRGQMDLSQQEFCEKIGVSRQWYSGQLKKKADILGVQSLSELALDQAGNWVGSMAIDLLTLQGDARFIPCICQTRIGDAGTCPKHGEVVEIPAISVEAVHASN